MPARVTKVNLLPPSEFEESFWGRFLKWAVTTGRYIIILTELVVILAFLSRFKLDEDLRNLNEQINGQVAFLSSQQPQVDQFLKLQKEVDAVSKMIDNRIDPVEPFVYFEKKITNELIVKSRSVTPSEFTLSAATLSEKAMGKLLASMSADGIWKSIDVTNLTGDRLNGILFTVMAKK